MVSVVFFLVVVVPWNAAILQTLGWEYVEVFLPTQCRSLPDYGASSPWTVLLLLADTHRGFFFPGLPSCPRRSFGRCEESMRAAPFFFHGLRFSLIFFSLAGSKLPGYVLPILPPLALLIGLLWTPAPPVKDAKAGAKEENVAWLNRSMILHAALSVVLGAAAFYAFTNVFVRSRTLRSRVRREGPPTIGPRSWCREIGFPVRLSGA